MRKIDGKCGSFVFSCSQVELHKTMDVKLAKGLAVDGNGVASSNKHNNNDNNNISYNNDTISFIKHIFV